jgi:type II secretory pathway component GspD/PulD (secretin)
MPDVRPKGALETAFSVCLLFSLISAPDTRAATPALRLGPDGSVAPFKLKETPLADFVHAYSEAVGTPISIQEAGGELKGKVSLYFPKPISKAALTELLHQSLLDNGYTVVDGPSKLGWAVESVRDARDGVIPSYDSAQAPATYRLITVFHRLKHMQADSAARLLRSFTPAYSRIVPASSSEVWVTADGLTIRKALEVLALADQPGAGAAPEPLPRAKGCPGSEQRIERLVVENLEIKNSPKGGGPPGSPVYHDIPPTQPSAPSGTQQRTRGVK